MTCGNRVTRSSSRAVSTSAAPSTSPAAEARSASARAASGQSHSHSVGGTPGEVAPVIAASYAPAGSPAPSRTCARTASNWNARKPEVSANSSSALARWSSASCCRPLERGELRGHQAGGDVRRHAGVRAQGDPEPVRAALPVPGLQQPAPLVGGHPGEVRVRSVEGLAAVAAVPAGRPPSRTPTTEPWRWPPTAPRGRSPTSRAPPRPPRRPAPPVRLRRGGCRTSAPMDAAAQAYAVERG